MSAEESKFSPAGASADDASKNAGAANQQRSGNKNKQQNNDVASNAVSVTASLTSAAAASGAVTPGNAGVEVLSNESIECPEPNAPESDCDVYCSNTMEALLFVQTNNNGHNENYQRKLNTTLVMDCGSSVDLVSNPAILKEIYESDTELTIRCNAGVKTTRYRGKLPGLGWVWLLYGGVANILSLSRMKERFRVTYDSVSGNSFNVIKKDGRVVRFTERTNRLYCFDMHDRTEESTILITTVEDNKLKFSGQDVAKADQARILQQRLGRPSTADFIRFIQNKLIKNCPVTAQDVRNAEIIYGPDLGNLKGKTTRVKPPPIRVQHIEIPRHIMEHYKNVTLSVDIMKVTGIPFLMTISQHIKFGTAGRLATMKTSHIIEHFKKIIGLYIVRGFRVRIMLADNQFESMRDDIANLHVQLHIVARDEHVPEVERFNRTIKERVRANYNILPFTHYCWNCRNGVCCSVLEEYVPTKRWSISNSKSR